jgi:glyoxylate/hydroxypyruvate reductase A
VNTRRRLVVGPQPPHTLKLVTAPRRQSTRRRPPSPTVRLHVHIDNARHYDQVFWITPARWTAACRRHADLGRRLRPTFAWDQKGLHQMLETAEILIGWEFARLDLHGHAPCLRWIHLTGAGLEHAAPFDWVPEGIVITNNSGVHGPKAGEYAAMAILMLNNRIPFHVANQSRARWAQAFPAPVTGKTLLIVGVGEMGRAAAVRAKQLGMRVLGIRRGGQPRRHVDQMAGPGALDRLLPEADIVLVTAPLTPHTRNLIGRRQLALMKPGAGLINMGRAGVVDYEALAEKLTTGDLGGAILDVFDPEPLPSSSPLWRTPNLIMTPHCSSDAPDYADRTLDLVFDNVRRYLASRPLRNAVDRKLWY